MKKNILTGCVLIILAVALILNKIGILPNINVFKIIIAAVLAIVMAKGIMKLKFVEIFLSLALIGCLFDNELGITKITPWILIVSAILFGAGLDMIFKDLRLKMKGITKQDKYNDTVTSFAKDSASYDGNVVNVKCSFGATTKYIDAKGFKSASIKNSFGQSNIYFDNAVMDGMRADVHVDNKFGETILHFPAAWQLCIRKSNAFGNITVNGQCNMDASAPVINVYAENAFGSVVINFD